jgi:hypothetical protein
VAEVWEEFVNKHAGEWESYSARFAATGAALELPRKYIPEAYAEWERTLHEWPGRVVSQCAKRGPRHLTHTLERFWPTVGCEYGKARAASRSGAAAARFARAACAHARWSRTQDDVAEVESHTLFGDYKERPFTTLWADGNYWCVPAAGARCACVA